MTKKLVFTLEQPHRENLQATQQFIQSMTQSLPEEVQQALVVRLADKTNMFGETYVDTLSQEASEQEARYSVQVHPYPWLAAGASNVIVHKNIFNELSVALVYNQRRDRRPLSDPLRQAGIPDFFKLPEGYMHPKPCKGGEKGINIASADDMDEAEELMLKGIPMQQAYKTIKEHKMRAESSPPSHAFDVNTKACAVRESHEEVGLTFTTEQVQYVSQREENRIIPTIANVYLIQAKTKEMSPPTLQVDGLEIREGLWGKLHAFNFKNDITKPEQFHIALDYYDDEGNQYAIEVPMKYALMIGQAIQRFRNEEIKKLSQLDDVSLFSSREQVEARVKQTLKCRSLNLESKNLLDILGNPPENCLQNFVTQHLPGDTKQEKCDSLIALSQLGKLAADYHKKIMALAVAFKKMSADIPLSAAHIEAIAKQAPAIEDNLLASRARLFPLARLHPQAFDKISDKNDHSLIYGLNLI